MHSIFVGIGKAFSTHDLAEEEEERRRVSFSESISTIETDFI
jgi:hypothetical protein